MVWTQPWQALVTISMSVRIMVLITMRLPQFMRSSSLLLLCTTIFLLSLVLVGGFLFTFSLQYTVVFVACKGNSLIRFHFNLYVGLD